MMSKETVKKFHTADVLLPRSGQSHISGMEFQGSFHRRHFVRKLMVVSQKYQLFYQVTVTIQPTFSLLVRPKEGTSGYLILT